MSGTHQASLISSPAELEFPGIWTVSLLGGDQVPGPREALSELLLNEELNGSQTTAQEALSMW